MNGAESCQRCGGDAPGGICPRCVLAAALAASADPPAASRSADRLSLRKIGGYEVLGLIGKGGMASVYRARDPQLGRELALKVLNNRYGETAEARFLRECQATARLDHPGIVRVHTADRDGGLLFLVLDLVVGESLEAVVRRDPLPSDRARATATRLAGALQHAHEHGVLHRDLKPANVLLTPKGDPVLVDFGLARLSDEVGLSRSGVLMGTPGFLAPEQAAGDRAAVGPHTDVYGLGATLYAMLSGRPPVEGDSVLEIVGRTAKGRIDPPSVHVPGIDPNLEAICLRCLEAEPAQRFASCQEVREALLGQARPAPRAVRTLIVVASLAGVALIALLATAFWGLPGTPAADNARRVANPPDPREATSTSPKRLRPCVPVPLWIAAHPGPTGIDAHVSYGADDRLHSLSEDGRLASWSSSGRAQTRGTLPASRGLRELQWWHEGWFTAGFREGPSHRGTSLGSVTGGLVAAAVQGSTLAWTDGTGGLFVRTLDGPTRTVTPSNGVASAAYCLAFAGNTSRLLVARSDTWRDGTPKRPSSLDLYALDDGSLIARNPWSPNRARALAVAPGGLEVVVGFATGGLVVHDTQTLKALRELKAPEFDDMFGLPHGGTIETVVFDPRGDAVYTLGRGDRLAKSNALIAWSWPGGGVLGRLELPAKAANACCNAAGTRLAIGYKDGRVQELSLERE